MNTIIVPCAIFILFLGAQLQIDEEKEHTEKVITAYGGEIQPTGKQ